MKRQPGAPERPHKHPGAPKRPYKVYASKAKRKKTRLRWLYIGIAAVVVIAAGVAGGSYIWFTRQVHGANSRVDQATRSELDTPPVDPYISVPDAPGAVNVLLLGSDSRWEDQPGTGRSDSLMIIHIDRTQNYLSMLSVPRDLYVDIPGHKKGKINAAYAYGGPSLTIKTVKQLTGVNITKFVEVDFKAFEDIVNSLGGVYVDIDRHYDKTPYPWDWKIDIPAGYQLLDGASALRYARFRFDANVDFGRMTRQQRLIQAIKEQAWGWDLTTKLPGLVSAAFGNIATNFDTTEVLGLVRWFAQLDGSRTRQITITGSTPMIDGQSVVVADKETVRAALVKLVTPPDSPSTGTTATGTSSGSTESSGSTQSTGSTGSTESTGSSDTSSSISQTSAEPVPIRLLALAPSSTTIDWNDVQAGVPFKLEEPKYLPNGYKFFDKRPTGSGTYDIKVGGGTKPAVRVIYRFFGTDLYLGISATTWTDAPLACKGTEVEKNGVKYTIVGSSTKTDHVWWKQDGVLYWVSNTLMYSISRDQLLKIAESMVPVGSSQ